MSRVYRGFLNVYVPTREIAALVRYIRDYFVQSWILRKSNVFRYVFALANAIGKSVSKRGKICINAVETVDGKIYNASSQLSLWDNGICVDVFSDRSTIELGGISLEVKSLVARVVPPVGWLMVPFYDSNMDYDKFYDEHIDFEVDANYLVEILRDFADAKLAYDFWWVDIIGNAPQNLDETLRKIAGERSLIEYLRPLYPQLHLPHITAELVTRFLDPAQSSDFHTFMYETSKLPNLQAQR